MINLTLAFPPQTHIGSPGGHLQAVARSLNLVFTSLSSNEWKVIIPNLPPTYKESTALSIAFSSTSSSLLTSILIAWKVFLAGCLAALSG